jgi:hypothetical protein
MRQVQAQKLKGLCFHQPFNIASACFEVKTTLFFRFCVGVTLGVDC